MARRAFLAALAAPTGAVALGACSGEAPQQEAGCPTLRLPGIFLARAFVGSPPAPSARLMRNGSGRCIGSAPGCCSAGRWRRSTTSARST